MITQQRASVIILGMITGTILIIAAVVLRMGYGDVAWQLMLGAAVIAGLWAAAWRGWEPSRWLAVFLLSVLSAWTLIPEPLTLGVLVPPILALVMANSAWIAASMLIILGGAIIRFGGNSVYADPINITVIVMATGGLILGRVILESARRHAEALRREADEARQRAEAREQEASRQAAQLAAHNQEQERLLALVQELEVPLLTVVEGILVLPLIGTIDTRRSEQIERSVLAAIRDQQARMVVIDLTGLTLIDSQVAQRLLSLARAITLLGAEPALTGMSAQLARQLVELGVGLGSVKTYGSVQTVLEQQL